MVTHAENKKQEISNLLDWMRTNTRHGEHGIRIDVKQVNKIINLLKELLDN